MNYDFFKDSISEEIASTWGGTCTKKKSAQVMDVHNMMFQSCKNKIEIKNLYRKTAASVHPDHGGDVKLMQQLNNYYQIALTSIKNGIKNNGQKQKFSDTFGW